MSEIFHHTKKSFLKLFRKFSVPNLKTTEQEANYKPPKNNCISSMNCRTLRRQHKKKHDLDEDDFMCIKKYIKKRINNNYEKQKNYFDENFASDKLYISLASRNSSISSSLSGGSLSVNKHRRVIYPTNGLKTSNFLLNYDFNYEVPIQTNETRTKDVSRSKNIVFEKVKINRNTVNSSVDSAVKETSCSLSENEVMKFCDDDDVQWEHFLKLRNHLQTESIQEQTLFQDEKLDNFK